MKRVFILCVFAVNMFAVSFASAAPPPNWRSVDVTQFDIAGVKLGMSYEQTLTVISEHFRLSPAEIKQVKDSTLYSYNRITKNKQPTSIRVKKDNISVEVSFLTRIPVNSGDPVAVSFINYSLPNTKENIATLKEAALSKYGQPSDSRRQANLMWCADYNQITQCEPRKPKMGLAWSSLVLDDYRLEDAASKYDQDLLKTKPSL